MIWKVWLNAMQLASNLGLYHNARLLGTDLSSLTREIPQTIPFDLFEYAMLFNYLLTVMVEKINFELMANKKVLTFGEGCWRGDL